MWMEKKSAPTRQRVNCRLGFVRLNSEATASHLGFLVSELEYGPWRLCVFA
jgi:hypothetical protein